MAGWRIGAMGWETLDYYSCVQPHLHPALGCSWCLRSLGLGCALLLLSSAGLLLPGLLLSYHVSHCRFPPLSHCCHLLAIVLSSLFHCGFISLYFLVPVFLGLGGGRVLSKHVV